MSNFWFTTWDVPEYKEWAQKKKYGYLLTIIRKQPQDFLAVKAKLIFKAKGLPQFVTLQSSTVKTGKEAKAVIKKWQGILTILWRLLRLLLTPGEKPELKILWIKTAKWRWSITIY